VSLHRHFQGGLGRWAQNREDGVERIQLVNVAMTAEGWAKGPPWLWHFRSLKPSPGGVAGLEGGASQWRLAGEVGWPRGMP